MPLMSLWRNFFLGSEPTKRLGPLRWIDRARASRITKEEMAKLGIDVRDLEQPVGTLSGGERQSVAIARAGYFGAKVLILDEPTSALGVKQSGVVLKRIVEARRRGLAVIFITHNPRHTYPVGNRFVILNRGHSMGSFAKADITADELTRLMAGGAELEALEHELEHARSRQPRRTRGPSEQRNANRCTRCRPRPARAARRCQPARRSSVAPVAVAVRSARNPSISAGDGMSSAHIRRDATIAPAALPTRAQDGRSKPMRRPWQKAPPTHRPLPGRHGLRRRRAGSVHERHPQWRRARRRRPA